MVKLINLR